MTDHSSKREEFDRIGGNSFQDKSWEEHSAVTASANTSIRRESTSPDEGIVRSLEEMESSPTQSRKKITGKLEDIQESQPHNHISITIKGGLTRDAKLKKRISKRNKTNNKQDNHTDALSDSKGISDHVLESERKEKHETSSSRASKPTKKKSSLHKSVRVSDKSIARCVVQNAHIRNSVGKKKKPVWVKIKKEAETSRQDLNKKSSVCLKTDVPSSSVTDGDKDSKSYPVHDRNGVSSRHHANKQAKDWAKLSQQQESFRTTRNRINTKTRERKSTNSSRSRKSKDAQPKEAPRTLRHHTQYQSENNFRKSRSAKTEDTPPLRSDSPDSSVGDLSYSTSSSNPMTKSSETSSTTDSTSRTESYSSSHSFTSSCTSSSSAASSSTLSGSSAQHISLTKISQSPKNTRQSKGRKPTARHKERPPLKSKNDKKENITKRRDHRVKERKPDKVKLVKCTSSEENDKRDGGALDMKPIQKAAKEIEKKLCGDDEQEFEVNLERRKKRNRPPPLKNDEMEAKDPHKTQWQHQHLVMTSRQTRQASPNARTTEKSRQCGESVKDSSVVLTIRDLYSLHHVLSDTQNGTVIAGHRRSDGMRVAIKRIAKSGTTRWGLMNRKIVPLELSLICQVNEVRHTGVVEIVEWHETTEAFLLVMVRPHPSVDLYDHVTKQKRLKEPVARRIIKQLVLSLLHCHKMGVLHRDVKLENILFNPVTMETILIDFGCGDYCRSSPYKEFAGTPEYYPPEWFLCKQYNGDSATVWSIGVLIYSLLCGTLPFRSSKDIITKTLTKFPLDMSQNVRHLIDETLQKNPRERIVLKSVLKHPWFSSSREHSAMQNASV